MDCGKRTLDELKKGYWYDKEIEAYVCIYCEQIFEEGQIFQVQDHYYVAEHAVAKHIDADHGGNLTRLLSSETKYNTLTEKQNNLLLLFHGEVSDKEIAKRLGVTEATIRRQRFTFREKAKQAKLYLAIYEQIFEEKGFTDNQMISVHNNANYVDDRYMITEQEKENILNTFFSSFDPLVLKTFSAKEKKKVVILGKIAAQFEKGKRYTEIEINLILKPIFEDYMTIRRYLVMYGFMERTENGSAYWLAK